jgi:transcriptional regulator with GAF, ATPase, and Fis domain
MKRNTGFDSESNDFPLETGKRISNLFSRSFSSLFKTNRNIKHLFFAVVKKLNKFFSLSNAVLAVYSSNDDCLKVIAAKGPKGSKEGLALSLPRKNSLFYKVFEENQIYIQNYPADFEGNFIEKKLLLKGETSSIAICPIFYKESVMGLLCMTSPSLYAFEMFQDGFLDDILGQFGVRLRDKLDKLRI